MKEILFILLTLVSTGHYGAPKKHYIEEPAKVCVDLGTTTVSKVLKENIDIVNLMLSKSGKSVGTAAEGKILKEDIDIVDEIGALQYKAILFYSEESLKRYLKRTKLYQNYGGGGIISSLHYSGYDSPILINIKKRKQYKIYQEEKIEKRQVIKEEVIGYEYTLVEKK